MKSSPEVTVVITSYNHEKYIKQAIDSVLAQKEINMEILLADDCSTDQTKKIMLEYERKHPEIIRILDRKTNLGLSRNLQDCFREAKGKYISFCEGDDYWIDCYKLNKQKKTLDENDNFSMCFNQVKILVEEENKFIAHRQQVNCIKSGKNTFNLKEIILSNVVANLTACMFRMCILKKIKNKAFDIPIADWLLSILSAEVGSLYLMLDIMSIYRVHKNGLWSGFSNREKLLHQMEISKKYNDFFNYKYDSFFEDLLSDLKKKFFYQKFFFNPIKKIKKTRRGCFAKS